MRYSTLFLLSLCLGVLLLQSATHVAHAESAKSVDELAEQIRKTDEQLAELKRTIDQNTTLKQDLQAAFSAAQDKRIEREARLSELGERISEFNQQLSELEATVVDAGTSVELYKTQLAEALRSAQSIGTSTRLRTLLQQNDPAHAQRLDTYSGYLFNAQYQQIAAAIIYLESVEEARLSALKDRNWLNHIRDKATRQRESFAQDAKDKRQRIDVVVEEIDRTTRTVEQLQQDQQRLQSLMEELEALQRSGSGYFAALQGQLERPVSGEVRARFGEPKSVGKLRWSGWFMGADTGTQVRAIADGEVVYSDWLQGFGMLVIIDHGDGYMTLYGGNRKVVPAKGTWVETGSTIATVGDSGGQNTSGLYFEIRHNAKALDPQDWLVRTSS